MIHATVVETPVGPLAMLAADDALIAAGFTADPEELRRRLHPRLRDRDLVRVADLGPLSDAITAYFTGDLKALDGLPVRQPGTPLRERLWAALRDVPAGTTVTYGELARAAGAPRAARAAGGACAGNLVAPVVPCHRVVPATGGLGGYYYGTAVKEWLLRHEGARVARVH